MAFVERMRNVLVLSPEKCGRWYGPSCALVGAAVASVVWSLSIGWSRSENEAVATSDMAIIVPDTPTSELRAEAPPERLIAQFMLGASEACAAGELPLLATHPTSEESFCPLHERDDYQVEPPDTLLINFQSDDARWQNLSGEYLVNPDGAVELNGGLGSVTVAGMTLNEIETAIEHCLKDTDDAPRVSASVLAQNSHVYYVIRNNSENAGDMVYRMPVVGNETVRDAVVRLGDLDHLGDKNIWIARPQAAAQCDTILPVQWREISSDPSAETNYKILSGDRIFVSDDTSDALETAIEGWIEPFRQLLGLESTKHDSNCPCQENGCDEECSAEDEY